MAQTKAKKKAGSASKPSAAKSVARKPAPAQKTAKKALPASRAKPSAAKPRAAAAKSKVKAKAVSKPAAKPKKAAAVHVKPASKARPVKSAATRKPVVAKPKATSKPPSRRAVAVSHRPQAAVASAPARALRNGALIAGGKGRAGGHEDIGVGAAISEDQIRRAPESAYMNDAQLSFFQERLLQMRGEVLTRELDVKERLHQREVFADPADRASAEEEHWLDLRLRERESLLLKKIDDALRRIRDRDYGYCEKTGEPIGIARLLARPTATVCVDIKGQDERAESQFRDR